MFWTSSSSETQSSPPPHHHSGEPSRFISSLFLLLFSSPGGRGDSGASSSTSNGNMATSRSNINHHHHHRRRHNHRSSMQSNSNSNRKRHNSRPSEDKEVMMMSSTGKSPRRAYSSVNIWSKKKKEIVFGLVIISVLSVTVYWNSLDGDFVHDDVVSIVRNPDVRPHSAQGWWNLWLNDYWGMSMANQMSHKSYRPLTVITFRINYWLAGGLSATMFHATNVMIHVVVSLLIFVVSFQVLRMSILTSFTASAIFAVHPVHTEAVAGITGRSDALACLLMLVSFLLYSKSLFPHNRRRMWVSSPDKCGNGGVILSDSEESLTDSSTSSGINKVGGRRRSREAAKSSSTTIHNLAGSGGVLNAGIIASGVFGCVAMLAKETGITVMGINIVYDLFIHKNAVKRWLITKAEDHSQSMLRRRVTFMMTLIFVSLGARLALMNGSFPRFSPQDNPAACVRSDLTRFLTYAFLPVFNAWLLIYPVRLSYDWQMGSIPLVESIWDLRNVYSALFYFILYRLLRVAFKKGAVDSEETEGPKICVSLLFISLPFLPASNLLFPVGFVAAERILYTPSIGMAILTAHGIHRIQRALPIKLRKLVLLFLCLMLMSFSLKTRSQNFVWKSRASLFESGVRENPWNAKVHYNYANLQKDLGDIETAVKHYKIAIRLWPTYASAYNNLGALSENMSVAEDSFLQAINANPQHNGAHFNLGVIYMRSHKYEEALEHLEECLKIDPSHMEALQYLGACYNVLNKTHEAENVFHKLISSGLPPSKLHTNFGVFLEELGLTSKALTHFLLALTKTSWDVQAMVHAAKLAYQLGAEQLFQELSERLLNVKFDPSVGYMLATSYVEKGKLLDASLLFEKLSEESDSFYKIHYTQLLMKVHRWEDAEWAIKGIEQNDPNHPISILLLAQIYENLNKTMDAYDLLHCAIESLCPQEANLCAQFYSHLGNLMHTTGAFLSATNYYEMAIQFNPDTVQAHTNIGAIYHLMSNYQLAEHHYLAALGIEPENEVVLSNIKKLERVQKTVAISATVIPTSHSHHNNNRPHQQPPTHFGRPVYIHNNPHKFHFSWR